MKSSNPFSTHGMILGFPLQLNLDQKTQNLSETMVQPSDVVEHDGNSTDFILEDSTTRMVEVLTKNQTQIHTPSYDDSAAQIGIKLDGTNYALWSQDPCLIFLTPIRIIKLNED